LYNLQENFSFLGPFENMKFRRGGKRKNERYKNASRRTWTAPLLPAQYGHSEGEFGRI
jgi:hypothetical protein